MRGFITEVERLREANIKLEREVNNIQEENNEVNILFLFILSFIRQFQSLKERQKNSEKKFSSSMKRTGFSRFLNQGSTES